MKKLQLTAIVYLEIEEVKFMKKYLMAFVFSGALLLSGCSYGESVEKQLSDILSEMYTAEQDYRDAQSELSKLEKEEQELFTNAMNLTQDQTEELEVIVVELKELRNKRISHINDEEASMKKANEFSGSLDSVLETIDEENKTEVNDLKKAVSDRYAFHSTFVTDYKKLLKLQEDLYVMLIDQTIEFPEIKAKVEEVNAQNVTVKSAIGEFNKSTGMVNSLKEGLFASLESEQ